MSRDLAEIMKFVERYPTVPLSTVVIEVVHAQQEVALGADDRTSTIAGIVAAKLADLSDEGSVD